MSWPAVHSQELKSQYRPCAIPENVFWEQTACTSLSQRRFIPSVDEPLQEILAQAPCLHVLCGAVWPQCELHEAGGDLVRPERKYSLSHKKIFPVSWAGLADQHKQPIYFTTTGTLAPFFIRNSSLSTHVSQLHKGKMTSQAFLHL